jgi:hypothetical protein
LLHRSAKSAQDAANVANKSIESLKSAERAHIDVEFVRAKATLYYFNAINVGKSPATIIVWTFARQHFPAMLNKQMPDNLKVTGSGGWIEERHVVNQILPVGPTVTVLQVDISHYLSEEQRSGEEVAAKRKSSTHRAVAESGIDARIPNSTDDPAMTRREES